MEVIEEHLDKAQCDMESIYIRTRDSFAKVNAGRAVPTMLQDLMVVYYGNRTPLNQLASISTSNPSTLAVQPWEQYLIPHIEKAIAESQLGFSTKNDGRVVFVILPPPSEEKRKGLVKLIKGEAEKGKVGIRDMRHKCKEGLKDAQKDGVPEGEIKRAEKKLQNLTDLYINRINDLLELKEAAIMTV